MIYIILFLFIMFSCTREDNIKESIYKCVKHERIKFSVDETVNPYALNIEFKQNIRGSDYLYILDGNNQLLKYDFKQKKLLSKIILEKEGNNGVGKATGFKIISPDSILVTSKFYQKIFLVNNFGIVLKSFSFKCDSLFTSYANSYLRHQIIIEDNELVIPQNLMGNWNHISKEYFDNFTTTINLNMLTGEIKKTGMKLPFRFPNTALPTYSFTKLNDSYVYSFFANDSLFTIDSIGNVSAYYLKTNNIRKLYDTRPQDNNSIESILRQTISRGKYQNLLSDTFNNKLYRFYKIGEKLLSNNNLMDLNNYPTSFGIQVISDKYKLLADIVFPEKTYFFSNSFVTEDGLFISVNHPSNPDFDVNYFTFDRFVFQEK